MQKTGAGEQKSCFSSPSPGLQGSECGQTCYRHLDWFTMGGMSDVTPIPSWLWGLTSRTFHLIPYVLLSFYSISPGLISLASMSINTLPCHTSYVAAFSRRKKPEEPSRGLTLALQSWCVKRWVATVSFLSIVLLLFWMQSLSWCLPLPKALTKASDTQIKHFKTADINFSRILEGMRASRLRACWEPTSWLTGSPCGPHMVEGKGVLIQYYLLLGREFHHGAHLDRFIYI